MTNEMQQNVGMEERKMTTINGFLMLFVAIALLAAAAASFFMIGGGAGIALTGAVSLVLLAIAPFAAGAAIRAGQARKSRMAFPHRLEAERSFSQTKGRYAKA